jgi:hypothetical protein
MAHYLFVRPDVFHAAPLAAVGGITAAWAIATGIQTVKDIRNRSRDTTQGKRQRLMHVMSISATVLAATALAYTTIEGADRHKLALSAKVTALTAPVARGIKAEPRLATPLNAVVSELRNLTSPGQAIYVLGSRADITTAGAPILYVLAERPNASRYDIQAPGVVTSAPVQREIVTALSTHKPKAIVRWLDPLTAAPEPNRAGRSSGVVILDRWIAAHYQTHSRHGDWLVLVPRATDSQYPSLSPVSKARSDAGLSGTLKASAR